MKNLILAIIAIAMTAVSNHALAQSASVPSADVIMQRLDALDKRNAKLESENTALRERVRLLEVGKRSAPSAVASAAPTVVASTPPTASSAMAMATKAPMAPGAAPYSWTGFYVGAHLGGGISGSQWSDPTTLQVDQGSHNATGLLGGIQGGYNWQMGHLVLGVEGQYSFADLNGDHDNASAASATGAANSVLATGADRFSTKINGIATIAGRVGFASDAIDRTLFFAKGGAAYARGHFGDQEIFAEISCFAPCVTFNGTESLGANANHWGWVVGAGLEYGLTQNWSAKIEYNYMDFGTKTITLAGTQCVSNGLTSLCQPGTSNQDVRQNIQTVTLGINYRFNPGFY